MPRLPVLRSLAIVACLVAPALSAQPAVLSLTAPALRCETPSPTPTQRARMLDAVRAVEGASREGGIVQIPVVFHVVTVGDAVSQGNVPQAWIDTQLNVLNTVFFPLGYRLVLVQQERVRNPNWWDIAQGSPQELDMKQTLARDPSAFLNLYSTRIAADGLGWAYLPGVFDSDPTLDEQDVRHGLVIGFDTMPGSSRPTYDRGDTAVHEMGHFLGLLHTFEGWSEQAPTGGCAIGDDVEDTPFEASPNFLGCDLSRDTCTRSPGTDPVRNFMDFSPDDCLDAFTPGQADRMAALFAAFKPTMAAGPLAFVVQDSLEFGPVVLGTEGRASLRFTNLGGPPLTVTEIRSSRPSFEPIQTQVFVQAGSSVDIEVAFTPPSVGAFQSTLTLVTDDPNVGTLTIPMQGTGFLAPGLRTTPLALSTDLPLGGSTALSLVLSNDGEGTLSYQVMGQGVVDGGPDAFGYTWRDSDSIGGPEFEPLTLSVADGATRLSLGDDDSELVQLPFAMLFYGEPVDAVYVASNGYLSFAGPSTAFENVGIPTPGDPDGLVAPLWDDLSFGTTSGVLTQELPDGRFVVQWTDMLAFETPGRATFQAILHASGDIVFQYLEHTFTSPSATIGIENTDGSIGLEVARDIEYPRAGLAVQFSNQSAWLQGVTPSAGLVSPGEEVALAIDIDAAGLAKGAYQDLIDVSTNDPARPIVRVHTVLALAEALAPPALVAPWYGDPAVTVDAPLSWLPAPRAEGYRIQVATDPEFQNIVEESVLDETSVVLDLDYSQAYVWRVRSLGAAPSDWSIPFLFTTAVFVADEPVATGRHFTLGDPYPNPVTSALVIPFTLARPAAVRVEAFDVTGRRVARLADGPFPAGAHRAGWAVGSVPAGVYLIRVTTADDIATARIVVVR